MNRKKDKSGEPINAEKYIDKMGRLVHRVYHEMPDFPDDFNIDKYEDGLAEKILHGKNERERRIIQRYLNRHYPVAKPCKPNQRLILSIILVLAYTKGHADWVKYPSKKLFIARTRIVFQKDKYNRLSENKAKEIYQTVRSIYTANFIKESPLIEIPILQLEQDEYYRASYLIAKRKYNSYFAD